MRGVAAAVLFAARASGLDPVTLAETGRQPQVAVAAGGAVAVVWGEPATESAPGRIRCRVSAAGGTAFAPAVDIAQVDNLALGMRRGPRVAWSGTTLVVLAISHGSGDLSAWRSADRGATWSAPVTVNNVPKSAIEGLHALAAAADGSLLACWLDGRTKHTTLHAARSTDGGATWSKNVLVYASPDQHICECCSPAAAPDGKGGFAVMWRNWLKGSRDMWLASSADGGRTFGKARKLGAGTWPLDACPMKGGAVAAQPNGTVLTLWEREGTLYECVPGKAERSLGEASQPWAAAGPGGVYRVWAAGGTIKAQGPEGGPSDLGPGSFPSIAAGESRVTAAWQLPGEKGGIVSASLR